MDGKYPEIWVISDSEDEGDDVTYTQPVPSKAASTAAQNLQIQPPIKSVQDTSAVVESRQQSASSNRGVDCDNTPLADTSRPLAEKAVSSDGRATIMAADDMGDTNLVESVDTSLEVPPVDLYRSKNEESNALDIACTHNRDGNGLAAKKIVSTPVMEESSNERAKEASTGSNTLPYIIEDDDDDDDNEEEEMDEDDVKLRLCDILDVIETSGRFAFSALLQNAANPGLKIRGHGSIGFPLSDTDIGKIVTASGYSMSNISSESDKHTKPAHGTFWEVEGQQLELQNPSWEKLLNQILISINKEMGIAQIRRGCAATLHALHLYQAGSAERPLLNSENPSTFGILDITLPSKHEGGQLNFEFGGKKVEFKTSDVSEYDCSCSAWFTDVAYETHIQSGHRLVLRYTLHHPDPGYTISSAGSLGGQLASLKHTLRNWNAQSDVFDSECLVYILSSHYDPATLCSSNLKGRDHAVVTELAKACNDESFYICLADLERDVVGQWDYEECTMGEIRQMSYVNDTNLNVLKVVELNGKEVVKASYLSLLEDDFIQQDFFDDESPDSEDYDKYDDLLSHTYRKTIVVIMPRVRRMDFLLGGCGPDQNKEMEKFLKQFLNQAEALRKDASTCLDVSAVCDIVTSKLRSNTPTYSRLDLKDAVVLLAFRAVVILRDKVAFDKFFLVNMLWEEAYMDEIRSMVHHCGKEWFYELIGMRVSALINFESQYKTIEKVRDTFSANEWADKQVTRRLAAAKFTTSAHAVHFSELTLRAIARPEVLMTQVLAAVRNNLHWQEMITKYFSLVLQKPQIPKVFVQSLVALVIELLSFRRSSAFRNPLALQIVLIYCLEYKWRDDFERLVAKTIEEVHEADEEELRSTFLTLLIEIAPRIRGLQAIRDPHIKRLFRTTLNTIVSKCDKPRPEQASDWARPLRGCTSRSCRVCPSLNSFLASPTLSTFTFRNSETETKHLQSRLSGDCATASIAVTLDRRASIWGLAVTKSKKEFLDRVRRWTKERDALQQRMMQIGPRNLEEMFGLNYSQILVFSLLPDDPEADQRGGRLGSAENPSAAPPQDHVAQPPQPPAQGDGKGMPLANSNSAAVNRNLSPRKRGPCPPAIGEQDLLKRLKTSTPHSTSAPPE